VTTACSLGLLGHGDHGLLGFLALRVRLEPRLLLGDELSLLLQDRDGLGALRLLDRAFARDVGQLALTLLLDEVHLSRELGLAHPLVLADFRFARLEILGVAETLGLGMLLGAVVLDLAHLLGLREGLLAVELELQPHGFHVLASDRHLGVALDLVALLHPRAGLGRDLAQSLGVEDVVGIELALVGLVEREERHVFDAETVLGQGLGDQLLHPAREVAPVLVQLDELHLRSGAPHRGDELLLDESLDAVGREALVAERTAGRLDHVAVGQDLDVELRADVHAVAILENERVAVRPHDLDLERLEREPLDVVDDRKHEGARVGDRLPASQTRPDERHVRRHLHVEPAEESHDQDRDQRRDSHPDEGPSPDRHVDSSVLVGRCKASTHRARRRAAARPGRIGLVKKRPRCSLRSRALRTCRAGARAYRA
jgi:hypothetical protein